VQSALCLRNQPVWHTILDKEALKKDNLGLSLVTGAETWASTEPDGHSGAGQLPGAWVSVASETEKTFHFGTFKLFKESTQKPSKTGTEK